MKKLLADASDRPTEDHVKYTGLHHSIEYVNSTEKNETDTAATASASIQPVSGQEKSAINPIIAVPPPCNQNPKLLTSALENTSPQSTQMVKTSWAFKLPPRDAKSPSGGKGEGKSGRLTKDGLMAHLDSMEANDNLPVLLSKNQIPPQTQEPPLGHPLFETIQQQSAEYCSTLKPTTAAKANEPGYLSPTPVPFPSFPKCPNPGQGVHSWCLSAAFACKRYGQPVDEAVALIKSQISRTPRRDEVESAVRKAYESDATQPLPPHITAGFDESELRALAYNAPDWNVDLLKSISPVKVEGVRPIQYLRHVFKRGEKVILTDNLLNQGIIWLNDPDYPESHEGELDMLIQPSPGKGAWFLSNPVSGEYVLLERLKSETNTRGKSLRAEENLTSFRYLVLESDEAPLDFWLSALVQFPLPIVSIVSSGGKSLHALVRVSANDAEQWRAIKQRIGPALVTLGADKNALTVVRLTRLPGVYRAEEQKWQELLYLNPDADETPICQLFAKKAASNHSHN